MKRQAQWRIGLWMLLVASCAGTVSQLGCFGKLARNINPCGTILNCDPFEYDLLVNDYPDWDLDPTCTIPGMCGGSFPTGGGGGTGTDTGTGTGTGTGTTAGSTGTGGLLPFF